MCCVCVGGGGGGGGGTVENLGPACITKDEQNDL